MCGIAGLLNVEPTRGCATRLKLARLRMLHRGPDDWGVLASGPAGFGVGREMPSDENAYSVLLLHLRLSILDLSSNGWQPMLSRDGKKALVFNGEIYNYQELRHQLEGCGYSFRSLSDSEVLLVALEHWGIDCLPRLNGMFAFAYVDFHARRALLARDPFGIKPLYWAPTAGGIAFASELPALLELSGCSRSIVPERLYAFLRFGVSDHGAGTLFKEARQLPPGSSMEIDLDALSHTEPESFWTAERQPQCTQSFEDAADEVREVFLENIRLHLQSDVPLGAALSGGIDSTAIVCGMRKVLGRDADIHAFGFVPPAGELSEEEWITLAADHAQARLVLIRPTSGEMAADLAQLVAVQGEPFGSPSIYAQRRVFGAAAEKGIKVMLDGQGADELLGGYRTYLAARIAGMLKNRRWSAGVSLFRSASTLPGTGLRAMSMMVADVMLPSAFQGPMRAVAGKHLMPAWMDGGWFRRSGVRGASTKPSATTDPFWEEMNRALNVTILPHLLRYEDRNSMAVGIESRVPFLTTKMLETLWKLPESYLVSDTGISKAVFRHAMRGIVPDPILDRRDKIGFVAPTARWMTDQASWVEGLLSFAKDNPLGGLNITAAIREWELVKAGKVRSAAQLWRGICYIEWARRFQVNTLLV